MRIIPHPFLVAALILLLFPRAIEVLATPEQNKQGINNLSGRNIPTQTPDLTWKPDNFIAHVDTKARYIDFRNGNDSDAGTKTLPWKHHPWDLNATGKAAKSRGIKTYFFKKGVTYRGALEARESGTVISPIRLSIDPEWGSGVATLAGSTAINKGWHICKGAEADVLPVTSRGKTWCQNFRAQEPPRLLWEVRGDQASRINIARFPNWTVRNPDDPRSDWLELTNTTLDVRIFLENVQGFSVGDRINQISPKIRNLNHLITGVGRDYIQIEAMSWKRGELKSGNQITNGRVTTRITKRWGTHELLRKLKDSRNLPQPGTEDYAGATIWAEQTLMPKPAAARVTDYDPGTASLEANFHIAAGRGPKKFHRYFLEDLPQFLDIPGEYYFRPISETSGIIYLRLPGDRDPNKAAIEAATRNTILAINNQSYIEISGLHFAYSNQVPIGTYQARTAPLYASAIQIRGRSAHINIHHCSFHHLAAGIIAFPLEKIKKDILDFIEVADSTFFNIDGPGIALGNGTLHFSVKKSGARLLHAKVLRNKLENIGYRSLAHWALGANGHGIEITGGEITEVAGNHINNVWGSGIAVYVGAEYERGNTPRPLLRSLIHHNKVTNSILGLQDYGGIASWLGGPVYMYNNISGNPVGYKYTDDRTIERRNWFRRSSFGIGLYLDGEYKSYVFNNIAWGLNNNIDNSIYNAAAFKEAMGFMNTVFNNTFFRFAVGMHKDMFQHNRSYYLGNLFLDMGHEFIQQEHSRKDIDYSSIAFTRNIFSGHPSVFGQLGQNRDKYISLTTWRTGLKEHGVLAHDTGKIAEKPIVVDSGALNFRLAADSVAIDYGVKAFVPWSLYRVVGEWNFLRSPDHPEFVNGENINMNKEWVHRSMYQQIPRNDLRCNNVDSDSYRNGTLEDWIPGALNLNGTNQYCELRDDELRQGYSWTKRSGEKGIIRPGDRDTVDISTDNFLVETVISTEQKSKTAGIASKISSRGYALELDAQGRVRMTLAFGNASCSRTSALPVNDGKWHHIIAEVDRANPKGINIYVDGRISNGVWLGKMNTTESLSNTSDFHVGRKHQAFFKGSVDFLRISKGTLTDAETDITELYDWQFNGPFLKDFSGNSINGVRRDAGAIEYSPSL